MSEAAAVGPDGRYWAFISYSHKDAVFGRRLHRRLEGYALPRRLVGQAAANGAVPRRLAPIFRDRDEFPAATDLSAEVRAALQASRSLIVVCSPTAASSPWVAREIELFHALHPGRPILAAIREGDPHDSFPEALRRAGPDGASVEPLAADFRRGHDGWDLGLLKLVAGVLGVGLDELIRRDAQRRARRVTAVTAGALALVLVMAVLTLFAIGARSEAERQRAEAEGLIGFMSTDLRYKLRGVGRLDIMSAVNQRALDYYDREIDRLTDPSRARRARVLQALGEDDENRGDIAGALKKFEEADRTISARLAADPNDPERIFDQAQTEFWFGSLDYDQSLYDAALKRFRAYKRLTDQLVAKAPGDPRYQREAGYAEGNLCSLALQKRSGRAEALRACTAALEHVKRAAGAKAPPSGIKDDLINRHAWLADAYRANRDFARSNAERLVEGSLVGPRMKAEPLNMDLKVDWVRLQLALALNADSTGNSKDARARLAEAKAMNDSLIAFDPTNETWLRDRAHIESEIRKLSGKSN